MLTPEQYNAFQKAVKKFDDYIQNHPEIIEEASRKWAEYFVDIKDVVLGDKIPFTQEINSMEVLMDEMELKVTPFEQIQPACPACNNRNKCLMYVLKYPDIIVKCIWFGWIEEHYNESEEFEYFDDYEVD